MQPNIEPFSDKPTPSTFSRIAKYITLRAAILLAMLAAGIFLTIVVVNLGGYIDDMHRADINEALNFVSLSMPGATPEQLAQASEQIRWSLEEAYGLHQPFLLRCMLWWYQTITFDWGETYQFGLRAFSSGPVKVTKLVWDRAPYTMLLAGTTNIIVFFASILVALNLSKKYGSLLDKIIITLSPLSAIPNWVYGIILTVIFAGELHLLPFNGLFDTLPPATKLGYIPVVIRHMILPVTAIFLGMFFSTVYTWRTFFLIHSGEDYLEMARAKGVPARSIERRYVLRPTLPYIITSFTILMITFWQGIIVLEVFFDWPGLGQLFMTSIQENNAAVTIGIVTSFALLIGLSVFLLDIIYVLVDPRLKIGDDGQTVKPITLQKIRISWASLKLRYRSQEIQKRAEQVIQRLLNLPDKRLRTQPVPARYATPMAGSTRPPSISRTGSMASIGYCPYLKLENKRGQALQAAPARCRCYAWDHPERIASTYQLRVCRTVAYHSCPRLVSVTARRTAVKARGIPTGRGGYLRKKTGGLPSSLRELFQYPTAITGILIIIGLIGISIYTVIAIPYKEAIHRWAPETEKKYQIPKNAMPAWVNLFRKDPLPTTIIQNSADGTIPKVFTPETKDITTEVITYTIDYQYGGFPKDMLIIFNTQYIKKPFAFLTWTTPDGREFNLGSFSVVNSQRYLASLDIPDKYVTGRVVQRQGIMLSGVGGPPAVNVLFADAADVEMTAPVKGTYTLRIEVALFEKNSNLDAEVLLWGQVYGLAGTDDLRRDLIVPLLWGTPIALIFGFLGAITTGVIAMIIAAIGVWYGGWVDNVIQRLTEINMILPSLPIAITIYYLYSKSIWMILGVIIILSIFGSSIKTYRAAFLQVKELPYVEAAQAYGASNWRIIRHYLVPRIVPLLIPQLVILVPSYVFFEATLAFLQVSDPVLPTWGKVIYDALTRGVYQGYYYWVLEPVVMMILTGLAFAVVGFALDSILNPRLRRI